MKKLFFAFVLASILSSCGAAYNTALKQIELGMTTEQVVGLMGDKYTVVQNSSPQVIEYKDRYKNNWYFEFTNNRLTKWYKTTDN